MGAGVSALWGCKKWKEMAGSLIHSCYNRGKIDYWTRESLLTKYADSPRRLITIAKSILGVDYLSELQSALKVSDDRKAQFPDLFKNLFALEAAYFTTNIDDNLSCLFGTKNIFCDPNEFNQSMIKPRNIIHLHGVINNPNQSCVDHRRVYCAISSSQFQALLGIHLLNDDYCFLFVGYGVDEMEIIDFMVEKYSAGTKSLRHSRINRFYILLPFFQNEESLLHYENIYFSQINMSVIPYAIDGIGHDQLHVVIERWRTDFSDLDKQEFYRFSPVIERNL